jgi:hypothetical protein
MSNDPTPAGPMPPALAWGGRKGKGFIIIIILIILILSGAGGAEQAA